MPVTGAPPGKPSLTADQVSAARSAGFPDRCDDVEDEADQHHHDCERDAGPEQVGGGVCQRHPDNCLPDQRQCDGFTEVSPRHAETCRDVWKDTARCSRSTSVCRSQCIWSSGYSGGICPAAWRAAQLGRTSTCLDPQTEQRNPPHTSGNGVSAA
jgi:hypothetical protein